jgi:DNA-binding IclR family transcriptional regulator
VVAVCDTYPAYLRRSGRLAPEATKYADYQKLLADEKVRGVIVATAEADKPLKISSPPGTTIPLMAGAVGKIFLSRLDENDARRVIAENGLPAYTPRSIVKEGDYLAELDRVRRKGYALDNEEYLPGVRAVAVGLKEAKGMALALWVVGFAASLANGKLPAVIDASMAAARQLENVLHKDIKKNL